MLHHSVDVVVHALPNGGAAQRERPPRHPRGATPNAHTVGRASVPNAIRERFTAGHAKKYVDKVHAQHRRGEAPPGQIDSAKVDWSGVGAR